MQSAQWSANSSSIRRVRSAVRAGLFVRTTIPATAEARHARTGAGSPSISTTQRPQLPFGRSCAAWQSRGISIPAPRATSSTVRSHGVQISRPSI